jgi:protein ImuB
MRFAALYIPDFGVQAVVRAEPELRGRAVALIDGTPPIWNVVAANAAALRLGIELGMARTPAEQFPGVHIRKRSLAQERAAHAALLDAGWSFSPRLEDTSPSTIVLDLAGLGSLFGSEESMAQQLAGRVQAAGLEARVATASNISAAILAARGFPGITCIAPGEEAQRLGILPVAVLFPAAENEATARSVSTAEELAAREVAEILERWGIQTCAALAKLPVLELSERLGQQGVRWQELARGAHARSLVVAEPNFSFAEELELEDAVAELEPLAFLLGRLLEQLKQRLVARALAFRAIHWRCELEPSFENALQTRPQAASRSGYEKLLTLPVATRDTKMLLNLLRLQLQGDPPAAAIQKIMMVAEPARPRAVQGGLFQTPAPDAEKLELTLARLAKLVGESPESPPQRAGSPRLVDTHRPDEFRMERFTGHGKPFPRDDTRARQVQPSAAGETKKPRKPGTALQKRATPAGVPAMALRMFRPPVAARVELREGIPARVFFGGTAGDVQAASGPWRTSGDWWREDGWQQDEWDLEIAFRVTTKDRALQPPGPGLYRFFYDVLRQGWFVRGMYD